MSNIAKPQVGMTFTLVSKALWVENGNEHFEIVTKRCQFTKIGKFNYDYEVLEVISIVDQCPSYKPSVGGAITELGWKLYNDKKIITAVSI